MSWKNVLKIYGTKAERWFIKTDKFASALPNELINQLGDDPTEKLADTYKNGLLIDLKNNTHYTIENGKITNIAQHGNF